ncbi:MAG TPA: 3-hydroxyacyl-CoA dehydrogenase NAD-binding domain-containing protein, partial [Bacillales bacterium]|nr:3-hydroxyacyl-CoA dehydrogenase NAD-binding domain-containing protein [Bacillales bacterium]
MIKHITVIGSGVMGRGIAYVAAVGGYETSLVDISDKALESAESEIQSIFDKGVQRNKLTEEAAKAGASRLSYSTKLEEVVSKTDLVIEAVPEKLEIKKNIFETIDAHAPEHCYFATNTSTMSPTEIAAFTKRPGKVIAMHFFNPVHKMPLIEVIRGLDTSEETVKVANEVAAKMGKETVTVNEFPGFVTSRISALVGNEAFYMLQEGVGSP